MSSNLFEHDYALNVVRGGSLGGMDEAGRGPLAGPVVVAAVIMPLVLELEIEGVNDSKKLSAKKREVLYDRITQSALAWTVQRVEPDVIDEINILNATKLCMKKCIEALSIQPSLLLVDAVKLDTSQPTLALISGDAISYNIAAASILAKVTRDRIMCQYDQEYPLYGFAQHKGYGTKIHIEALGMYGECPIHRRTFCKKFI